VVSAALHDAVPLHQPAGSLRIGFGTHEYVTEGCYDGGIANHLHRVAKSLAAMGHDVHIVTRSEIDQAEFYHDGVMVHRVKVGSAWYQLNRITRYQLTTTVYLLGLSTAIQRKLRELNEQKAFQLLQFPNTPFCGLWSILFLRLPHVLLAASYQPLWNDLRIQGKLDFKAVAWLEKLQTRLTKNIYAPSAALQQTLKEREGLPDVKVIRTPIYLETEAWDSSVYTQFLQGKQYLLFFGRFELRKGFHILARSLPALFASYPNAFVVLVGRDMESDLAPSMAQYARALSDQYQDRLIVLEQLPHTQLYPIIEGAHLVVLPSLLDNAPNACLEAMALGKPVLGTTGASFEELISDQLTGFLVAPDDVAALSDKIVSAWKDPRLVEIGRAAKKKSLEFAPAQTVASLLDYYHEVLQSTVDPRQ
jgi:glycosyltransferase involved in cell wall biosynthesis